MRPTIFLSRPAVLSGYQEQVFNAWSSYLTDLEFKAERLQRHQYSGDPWDQLRTILGRADGVVAFGFSQPAAHAVEFDDKPSGPTRTSPWIHIEAAMAIETARPVLAVPEAGIDEGVFEPSLWSGCLYGIPPGTAPSRGVVPTTWVDAVHQGSRRRSAG
jgi:hypothetical protein